METLHKVLDIVKEPDSRWHSVLPIIRDALARATADAEAEKKRMFEELGCCVAGTILGFRMQGFERAADILHNNWEKALSNLAALAQGESNAN